MTPPSGANRPPLREQLARYLDFLSAARADAWGFDTPECIETQAALARRFLDYLGSEPWPFHRETRAGHVTGSACLASRDLGALLLLRHAKLGKWLQPGGHSDGDPDTAAVALREATEETGLVDLATVSPSGFGKGVASKGGATPGAIETLFPIDLDVHEIPARGDEPAHLHWDVRYLVTPAGAAGPSEPDPTGSHESTGIAWVPLGSLGERTREESVLRLGRKVAALARRG